MKRLVICCDGTWNELDYRQRPTTNVVKLAQSVSSHGVDGQGRPVSQVVFYNEGVGTLEGESLQGGGFANGLEQNIKDAYAFLVFNYDPGDEIYVFGFSRGAYTARSLVGMIRNCGILRRTCAPSVEEAFEIYKSKSIHPDSVEARQFREAKTYEGWWVSDELRQDDDTVEMIAGLDPAKQLTIEYVGVWDTVGQLGIPGVVNAVAGKDEDHGFHDLKLSSMVKRARHAVALDESREVFRPTLWEPGKLTRLNGAQMGGDRPYQQLWFAGDHGSVGGGGDLTGLSDITLEWIADGARQNGALLHYDEAFKGVDYEVEVTIRRKKVKKHVRFNANGIAPLKNISDAYKEAQSPLNRLFGFAMNAISRDRISDLPALEDIHPTAKAYAGYEGDHKDYRKGLVKRLKAYTRFLHRDIEGQFP
ncbi:MAG: hypothetical protein CMK07_10080 [Ponticaulis sp.]|nr:hypothetical protein [Ponticaulis sp.]